MVTVTAMLVGVKTFSNRLLAAHEGEAETSNKKPRTLNHSQTEGAERLELKLEFDGEGDEKPQELRVRGHETNGENKDAGGWLLDGFEEEKEDDFDDFGEGFTSCLQQRLASVEKKMPKNQSPKV